MISKRALIALTAVAAGGCQPQTLADQYLAEMEEIGNVGSTAGKRVLQGKIKRGDGERLRQVLNGLIPEVYRWQSGCA